MLSSKEFVAKLVADNQALFQASQHNVKAYFDSKPAKEELVEHFVGRMVNERMNMVEISRAIAEMPADADPVELQLLTQQAHDEAVHFRLVKEVIEHIQGSPLDVTAAIASEAKADTAKGAALLKKYEADTDPAALDSLTEIVAAFQSADGNLNSAISNLSANALAEVAAEESRATAAEAAIRTDYDALIYTFESVTAASTHIINHNLGATFVTFTVLVERDDGSFRNDIVSVEETSTNRLTVYLTEARNIKISVMSMAGL